MDTLFEHSYDNLIKEIIKILKRPAEDYTDGECLDAVVSLLQESGYEINWDETE